MDLSGTWRAAHADEPLRRRFPDPDFDDGDWAALPVPSHWRTVPAFESSDGPLLCRRRFESPPPGEEGERWWLVLDGIFYQGDVWLDGSYVGDTEGYFFPHAFEVTGALAARREHLLAVEVTCSRPDDPTAKRNLTGVFQHWDCIDPAWNPGGIWRPVRLVRTGPVRIARLRCLCAEATPERAVVRLRAVLDAAVAGPVSVRTAVGATEHEFTHRLAAGENQLSWQVEIDQPDLWWPRALGDPVLHDVVVEVTPKDAGAPSDRRSFRTGLRQVRMRRWITEINGERLFLKGSNQGPATLDLAGATPEQLARDVELALAAGLDFLRLHAHITRPEVYAAADEMGLLLWQDLPLQWGYALGVRRQAVRQAREAVDLLGHHPSVFVWCGHNEPLAIDTTEFPPRLRTAIAFFASQELPTWNKTVLDGSIKRALHRADPTRPVVAHSGVWPHPGSGGTDSHLYFGWYHGHERDLPRALALFPRLARFVSEFGAQAVPADAAFCEPERWPDLDWERLGRHHALQKALFDRHVPPAAAATFEDWREATQAYQATLIKHHVETLRRLKYRPTGGFAHFCFADAHPAVTWSVLGHDRAPKQGYHALAAACAPVIVVADRPAPSYAPGEAIALDVHVVSDLRTPLTGAVVRAALTWSGGEHQWAWTGDVPADACVRVGTIQAVAPDQPGELRLDLELVHAEAKAANTYRSVIERRRPPPGPSGMCAPGSAGGRLRT
jgi:beta-mannosidase